MEIDNPSSLVHINWHRVLSGLPGQRYRLIRCIACSNVVLVSLRKGDESAAKVCRRCGDRGAAGAL